MDLVPGLFKIFEILHSAFQFLKISYFDVTVLRIQTCLENRVY